MNFRVTLTNDAGDITLNTKLLQVTNNGQILASTFGSGNAGDITIYSSDAVVINNGIISSSVEIGAVGNGGDIQIQTPKLSLTNGGQIDVSVWRGGRGESGNIRIDATNSVIISGVNANGFASLLAANAELGSIGKPGEIMVNTDYFLIEKGGFLSTGTYNSNNGGSITINTRIFEALTGGQIFSSTGGSGKAGDININATDSINLSGVDANSGSTAIFAGTLTDSTGGGGQISLFTTNFSLSNNAGVITRSLGRGVAGDINITASNNFNANSGFINARAEQSSGGNINVNARNINLQNGSKIRTDLSSGNAKGGNIFLTADTIIALEDSDILAFAPSGQGGYITFNTRAVFSDSFYNSQPTSSDRNSLESLINNGQSNINASGSIAGNIIGIPDISFIQNGLTELQNNPIDTNALIANSCIARTPKQEGNFIITGTGGLPTRPGEAMASSYSTGDVQNVSNNSTANSWKKGDPIVEPHGVYRLDNGELVMSRECP
jgi:large exoprotein involved in heme utilization and adhesion